MQPPAPESPPIAPLELTEALRAAGTLLQGSVESIAITKRIHTTVSNLWFLEIDYASGSTPALPTRLVLKWPLEQSPAPERGRAEPVFYRQLAPALPSPPMVRCLATHGDAHTWNFLFPRAGDGLPFLIDWQLWHLDVGARDLAFMIALHWDRAVRRKLELPLLNHYHREIVRAGVNHYSFDDLWLDYRRCAVRNLTFPIILWARGLPREAWRHRLDCALAAYRDLEGAELL